MATRNFNGERTALILHTLLSILRDNGGEMRYAELKDELTKLDILNDHEKGLTKKGYVRWKQWIAFMSIELKTIGYIIRKNGIWILTKEGEEALKEEPWDFFEKVHDTYREKQQLSRPVEEGITDATDSIIYTSNIESLISEANSGIFSYIKQLNPYDFQALVAALLRAMGYYTPFIAPKGKDGGIDIIAYQDPLGASAQQLKVQVKHYPTSKISVDVVRNLAGVLSKENEVGLIVTSGKFTSDAEFESRRSHKTLRLIDADEFINLWIEYYKKMPEDDKKLLPIKPIYFLDNEQQ